jgi:hypothetical protein
MYRGSSLYLCAFFICLQRSRESTLVPDPCRFWWIVVVNSVVAPLGLLRLWSHTSRIPLGDGAGMAHDSMPCAVSTLGSVRLQTEILQDRPLLVEAGARATDLVAFAAYDVRDALTFNGRLGKSTYRVPGETAVSARVKIASSGACQNHAIAPRQSS